MLKYAEKGRGDLEPYFSYHGNLISAHYAADDAPDPDRFRMHTHDACELFCFLEGKGSFQIEGSSYLLTPGDILLMRPLEAHYIRIDPACRYTRFAIHFRPSLLADIDPDGRLLRPFTGREAGRRNLYHAEDFDSPLSRLLLQNAVAPCEDRRLQLITCLVPLLGEIERVFRAQSDAPADETQVSLILLNGAWNVGLILDDINNMPESAQFDWATFNIPDFANAPEGFGTKMRGLYVLGNVMGIVPKNDADHDARVLDFYLYWYSQAGAQMCYEETLSNGNFVQGPCMINGVVLKDELMEKLTGFVVEGAVKAYSSELCGLYQTQEADRPIHNDLINKLTAGEIDIDTFLDGLATVQGNDTDAKIEAGGYDLDPTTADTAK